MQIINQTQLSILEALGRFQYMTTKQLMQWGVTRNQRHLYAVLKEMEGKARSPIQKLNFGVIAGVGRLHSIYHLTKNGAGILLEAGVDQVQYPRKSVTFTKDYFHRIGSVDIHISFEQWTKIASGHIKRFETYYDRTAKNARGYPVPKTSIHWESEKITPDLICEVVDAQNVSRLCAIELHRGKSMLRLDKQLKQYEEAVKVSAIENTYDYPSAVRVLIIFDDIKAMATCIKRLAQSDFSPAFKNRLFLNHIDAIKSDLLNGWLSSNGEQRKLW